ncbi:MAG TPA: hypothetical protein PKE45_18785, partial [Caldilineaceae bacterium]|nr:hypothetical protein [Caldilineaceae bacterium]
MGKAEQSKIIDVLSRIRSKESPRALRKLLSELDNSLQQEARRLLGDLEQSVFPIWWFDSPHIDRTIENGDATEMATLTSALKYGLAFNLPYLGEYDRLDAV